MGPSRTLKGGEGEDTYKGARKVERHATFVFPFSPPSLSLYFIPAICSTLTGLEF